MRPWTVIDIFVHHSPVYSTDILTKISFYFNEKKKLNNNPCTVFTTKQSAFLADAVTGVIITRVIIHVTAMSAPIIGRTYFARARATGPGLGLRLSLVIVSISAR